MPDTDEFNRAIEETCRLLRKNNGNKKGTLSLSPEVAQLIEGITVGSLPMPGRSEQSRQELTTESTLSTKSTSSTKSIVPVSPSELSGIPDLPALEEAVSQCTNCPLAATRTRTVFGSGNPHAKLVFVGEAPGQEEDVQGKPFVGRAGQLLTDIIEKGMNLKRSDVYICNVLKCRPPNNRDPLPAEVEQCEPYLIRQLELIRPKVICALGTHAAQTLLKTNETIGRLRGKWHFYHGIPLRATYHPAYLLRSPGEKKKTWIDVQEVIKVYNGEVVPEP